MTWTSNSAYNALSRLASLLYNNLALPMNITSLASQGALTFPLKFPVPNEYFNTPNQALLYNIITNESHRHLRDYPNTNSILTQ